ncbi:hypothetical protein, partial [Vibrio cholerae]
MINDRELKLLISLLKEIDKYGLDTFDSLREKIKISNSIDLDFISSLYRKLQVRVPRKSIDYHDEVLKSLKMIDLERREEIASLISLIKDKISFKNISEFSAYLNNLGVYERKISSWQEGIFR